MSSDNHISIFTYLSYRDFLKDVFAVLRKTRRDFAHKTVLAEMGISSSGFLSNVIAGRKNLTPIQAAKLAKILKLNKAEASYFEGLVLFTQARTLEEREEFFDRLVRQQKLEQKVLDAKKMSLFARDYYVFIRELLNYHNQRDDYAELAAMLDPPIKASEARDAVEQLIQMGLVERGDDGVCRQVDASLTTGDEVRSMHLAAFQKRTLDLAKRALGKIPAAERDISTLTFTLSPDSFRLVKDEVKNFRKRIAKIAMDETSPNGVYQLNMQFFPVTKARGTNNAD